MKNYKRGQALNALTSLGIGLAGMVIAMAVVFLIMSQVGANTQVADDANATAAVNTLTDAAADIPDWVPLVIIASVGAILLALVSMFRRGV